jgi:hypothetical protein
MQMTQNRFLDRPLAATGSIALLALGVFGAVLFGSSIGFLFTARTEDFHLSLPDLFTFLAVLGGFALGPRIHSTFYGPKVYYAAYLPLIIGALGSGLIFGSSTLPFGFQLIAVLLILVSAVRWTFHLLSKRGAEIRARASLGGQPEG